VPPPASPPSPAGEPEVAAALQAAKSVLRRAVLLRRDLRSPAARAADDAGRTAVLITRLESRAGSVATYLSTGTEPSTLSLLGWLAATERRVLLPVLTDGMGQGLAEPAWAPYEGPDRLRVGRSGILEPTGAVRGPEALVEVETVLCPGLAGDPTGRRLGRGGGWYDRALAHARPGVTVAVLLNEDEVLEVVPTQPWDRPVDALATPSGWLPCPSPEPTRVDG